MNKYQDTPESNLGSSCPPKKNYTIFSDFTSQLEKEKSELWSIAESIDIRLHRIKNTNFPICSDDNKCNEVEVPRGNDDLEYELFNSLSSLRNLRMKLQESLNKLETII